MPDAMTALLKDGLIQRLPIEPLQRTAMAGLAEHTLGRRISSAAEEQLWKRTLGNPLFARELLLGAVESGALVTKDVPPHTLVYGTPAQAHGSVGDRSRVR